MFEKNTLLSIYIIIKLIKNYFLINQDQLKMGELENFIQKHLDEVSEIAISSNVREIKIYHGLRDYLLLFFRVPDVFDQIRFERRLKELIWKKTDHTIFFECCTPEDLYVRVKNYSLRKSQADTILKDAQTWYYPREYLLPFMTFLPKDLSLLILQYL